MVRCLLLVEEICFRLNWQGGRLRGVTGRQANGQFKGVESDSGFPGSTLETSTTLVHW